MAPYEPQPNTKRVIRRTPSDSGIPLEEVERIAEQAAKEAERDLLLKQLSDKVDKLCGKMDSFKDDINSISSELKQGTSRMNHMDKGISDLEKKVEEHEKNRTAADKEQRTMWAKVGPNLVTSVLSTVITAALMGGLAYSVLMSAKENFNGTSSNPTPASSPDGGSSRR